MNEINRRGGVQVPVQLVQNDPLHAKNLRCRKAAPALHNQVFNGAYYLCEETPTKHTHKKKKKGNKYRFERTLLSLSVYPHLIFLVDFGSQDQGGKRDASQVFWLSLKNTERFQDLVADALSAVVTLPGPSTLTVDSRRLRMQTPSAEVSGQNWKSRLISPSQRIISRCCAEEMFVP